MKLPSVNKANNHQRIQKLVDTYQRLFPILSLNFEVKNSTGSRKDNAIATKKCPLILLMLFVCVSTVFVISQQLQVKCISRSELNAAFCFMVLCVFVTIAVPVVHSAFHFHEIHVIWCKVDETAGLALNELNFEMFFGHFWKRFLVDCGISLTVFGMNAMLRFIYLYIKHKLNSCHFGLLLLHATVIYMRIHALFIIHLYSFLIRLLIKYIDGDYHNRASNVIFDCMQRSLSCQLRSYKQIHFKLYEIARAIDNFFGLTLLAICYYTFAEVAYSWYYIFYHLATADDLYAAIRNETSLK